MDVVTLAAFTVKLADVAPPGTVTVEGTVASEVFPLSKVTTAPAAGAGPSRVTVNRTEVTGLLLNLTGRPSPLSGSVPTLMLDPSLKESVPARTLSIVLGLS